MNRRRPKLLLFIGATLVALVYAGGQMARCAHVVRQSHKLDHELAGLRQRHGQPAVAQEGTEAALHRAARDAKLKRLMSVASTGEAGGETNIEWESDAKTSLAYLALLRERGLAAGLPRLSLTIVEQEPGLLRGRATLRPGHPEANATPTTASGRDVFTPLWKNDVQFARLASENIQRQEEERRRDQERSEKARVASEAVQQKEARRHAFETRYALTGIGADGKGPIAFLTGTGQRSYMVRTGERIDDASVTSIDEKSGEVKLDGAEALSVVLKIGAVPQGQP